jgi:hypothetical protein
MGEIGLCGKGKHNVLLSKLPSIIFPGGVWIILNLALKYEHNVILICNLIILKRLFTESRWYGMQTQRDRGFADLQILLQEEEL